jgi:hypothetical protein
MLTEALPIKIEKHMAVAVLLLGHLAKYLRRRRVAFIQVLGEGHIDPRILFLRGDRDGKNFAFGEVTEFLRRMRQASEHEPDLLRIILRCMYPMPGRDVNF